jgi:hypothetical protein
VVTVVRPERAELADTLSANGSVAAWQEATVGAEVNGLRIAEVRAEVGDIVKRGQVLVVFAADTVRADVAAIADPVMARLAAAAPLPANSPDHVDLVIVSELALPNGGAVFVTVSGANQAGRPAIGSWLTYGLGTENKSLPGFVVLCPTVPTTVGSPLWSNGFLPAINQGTYISSRIQTRPGAEEEPPMPAADAKEEKDKDGKVKKKPVKVEAAFDPKKLVSHVNNPKFELTEQRRELTLLENLEKIKAETTGQDQQVEAVMKSMEIAYRMQTEAPEVFDIRKESQATLDLYGEGTTARGCLQAVRLVESASGAGGAAPDTDKPGALPARG